ncbi:hypothetical protein [Alcanivorax sp. 1008]|uniref:hypothetical protein n=1 Tax=Alcanivorax sp. 1008 TaxID=2816853 RepID=UPI001D87C772|nr:hypothetical protein [Alcanivorax sp. 1008]MCC1496765.1 hypothetical protein [Alcanivorax sp. 1008]
MTSYTLIPEKQRFKDCLITAAERAGEERGEDSTVLCYQDFLDDLIVGMPVERFREAVLNTRLSLRAVLDEHGSPNDRIWLAGQLPTLSASQPALLADFRDRYLKAWYLAASNHAGETGEEFHQGDLKDAIHESLLVMGADELIDAVVSTKACFYDTLSEYGMNHAVDDLVTGLERASEKDDDACQAEDDEPDSSASLSLF